MAIENDDWRAQRAAQLAGTPFARPSPPPRDRIDDTLPIGRAEPAVSLRPPAPGAPPAASADRPVVRASAGTTRWWLPITAVLAVVVAAVVWLAGGRDPRPAIVATTVAAPVDAGSPANVPAAPTRLAAPATPPTALAAATLAPVAGDPTIFPMATPHVSPRAAAIAARAPNSPSIGHRSTSESAERVKARPTARRPAAAPVLPVVTITKTGCPPGTSRMVCASPTLMALDGEMRQLSAGVAAEGDAHLMTKADKGEASFVRKRDHCKDEACLAKAYAHRIKALQKLNKKAADTKERAREMALPICAKGVSSSPTTCRPAHRRFSLRHLIGG